MIVLRETHHHHHHLVVCHHVLLLCSTRTENDLISTRLLLCHRRAPWVRFDASLSPPLSRCTFSCYRVAPLGGSQGMVRL